MKLILEEEDGEIHQEDLSELIKMLEYSEDATLSICRIAVKGIDGGRWAEVQIHITTNEFDFIS